MSFGFNATDIRWSKDGKTRSIHQGKLFEISLVVDPAYKNTQSELRSDDTVFIVEQTLINTKRINTFRRNWNI
jgi:phage head maturation protease